MTEWWEHGYPGGPMVKVAGFPRPLYPPDANQHGKKPSMDGPDVVAYKRTVSRAGRWPWQAFDDAYSNGFAHGNGPNVRNTGVAGVQRQQHIDASGWLGKATFNTLRSIIVPEGLGHAGEMAMDAYAADLINDAWEMFGGHEPDASGDTLRKRALQRAIGEIGTVESPAGSNLQRYGEWYGFNGVPWCAIFEAWCFEQEGDSPAFVRGSRYSYVPYIVADARMGLYGLRTVGADDVMPGDLVCYDWEGNGEYDHTGIFEAWQGGTTFAAIEGNTSTSNDSNGGQVMRRVRNSASQATVFVRVAEPA
jgi:hypothetical protein